MRKLSILATLLLLLSLALVACGGDEAAEPGADVSDEETTEEVTEEEAEEPEEEAEETTEGDCASEDVFCVGLVTDVGEIDDKSFNQSAWEGVQQIEEQFGAQVDYIETKDAKDYAANIDLFAENGYDAIVTVGFALGQATTEAAERYPDVDFVGVDQFQSPEAPEGWEGEWPLPNVVGLIFPEDQAGYLAGVLAAELSESGTIAAVLGTDLVPPVVAFKEGYEAGALATNPDINIISTYHPGGMDVAFTDPEWGASTAAQAIDQGADVVFGAGGKTGNGALIEVAGHDGVYCIGVDTDQWETVPEAHPCLVTSAMKLITPGVADLLEMSEAGNLPTGNFVGEVGLASYHDFEDEIPQETKDLVETTEEGLAGGEIETGYAP
jgi:basic membrane protein A